MRRSVSETARDNVTRILAVVGLSRIIFEVTFSFFFMFVIFGRGVCTGMYSVVEGRTVTLTSYSLRRTLNAFLDRVRFWKFVFLLDERRQKRVVKLGYIFKFYLKKIRRHKYLLNYLDCLLTVLKSCYYLIHKK